MNETTSFTQVIKEEICNTFVDLEEDSLISLLSSFVRANGSLLFSNGRDALTLEAENAKVIRFIYEGLKKIFPDLAMSFSYRKMMNLNKATKYIIKIENSEEILNTLKIDFLNSKIDTELTNKDVKVKAYFAGLFLTGGSCNSPSSSNYHLEISFKNEDFAKAVLKLVNKIKVTEFNFKMIERRQQYVLYLKKSDQISMFLAYIEANNSCLEFENTRMNRDYSNNTNRLMLCDTYNYARTLESAKKQVEMIEFIDKKLGIKNIANESVRILCRLRLENPEATYLELANELGEELETTVSKSRINHYFRKIKEIAIRLHYDEEA